MPRKVEQTCGIQQQIWKLLSNNAHDSFSLKLVARQNWVKANQPQQNVLVYLAKEEVLEQCLMYSSKPEEERTPQQPESWASLHCTTPYSTLWFYYLGAYQTLLCKFFFSPTAIVSVWWSTSVLDKIIATPALPIPPAPHPSLSRVHPPLVQRFRMLWGPNSGSRNINKDNFN